MVWTCHLVCATPPPSQPCYRAPLCAPRRSPASSAPCACLLSTFARRALHTTHRYLPLYTVFHTPCARAHYLPRAVNTRAPFLHHTSSRCACSLRRLRSHHLFFFTRTAAPRATNTPPAYGAHKTTHHLPRRGVAAGQDGQNRQLPVSMRYTATCPSFRQFPLPFHLSRRGARCRRAPFCRVLCHACLPHAPLCQAVSTTSLPTRALPSSTAALTHHLPHCTPPGRSHYMAHFARLPYTMCSSSPMQTPHLLPSLFSSTHPRPHHCCLPLPPTLSLSIRMNWEEHGWDRTWT